MLSQDVGFFDTDITTGEIVSRISSDTILVQEAISEKVCYEFKPLFWSYAYYLNLP